MDHYTQLTHDLRYQIYALNKAGILQVEIAHEIGVNKTTISREMKRNSGLRGYRPEQAHQLALSRKDSSLPTYSGESLGRGRATSEKLLEPRAC